MTGWRAEACQPGCFAGMAWHPGKADAAYAGFFAESRKRLTHELLFRGSTCRARRRFCRCGGTGNQPHGAVFEKARFRGTGCLAGGKACLHAGCFCGGLCRTGTEELPNSGGYRRKVRAGLLRGVYALRSWSGGAACPSGRREPPVRKAFAGNCALCGENGDACVCRLDFAEALPQ